MINYTLTNNSLTIVLNNKVYTVNKENTNWDNVLSAIRNNDETELLNLVSPTEKIISFTEGNIVIKDNQVIYKGEILDNYVVSKVMEFAKNDLPLQPILRFINKLMENPSRRAVQELYSFLEHKHLPITPDGNFLAYKGVNNDYYSITSGKLIPVKGTVKNGRILNTVGQEIEVHRNKVCDDKNNGCSTGLHAGSLVYATSFGPKTMIVEINPADVVSIPVDSNCQKLRTCKYKVVGEFVKPLDDNYDDQYADQTDNDDGFDDDGFDDDWFDENEDNVNDDKDIKNEEKVQDAVSDIFKVVIDAITQKLKN